MIGATPFLHGLATSPTLARRDLSSLRVFGCGGADVPPQLIRQASRTLGIRASRLYGSTECPAVTGSALADPERWHAETDGRPIGGGEARVVAADGRALAAGERGLLQVRGPELCLGYLDPALNASAFDADGWFHTGDIAEIDGDGCVRIAGRAKDVIVRGGENISAKEVEDLLFEHPDVREVAVVGYPDEVLGERACAVVVAARDDLALEELIAFLRAREVANQKLPERLELVAELPKTSSGKVQKFRLPGAGRVTLPREQEVVTMARIRAFEERVSRAFKDGRIPGFVHVSIGQEAVAAGVCGALERSDMITTTHRGHGHCLAKGADAGAMMAELFGRADGTCGGKGGSMHIADTVGRGARRQRDRRRRPAARRRRGAGGEAARQRRRRGRLRRRGDGPRRLLPRGARPRRAVGGAGAVRDREQPLRRVHRQRGDLARRAAAGAGPRLRPRRRRADRRQRRRGRSRRDAGGGRGAARGRRTAAAGGDDLPPPRPLRGRPGRLPRRGRESRLAGARPARGRAAGAGRGRARRRRGGGARRGRGGDGRGGRGGAGRRRAAARQRAGARPMPEADDRPATSRPSRGRSTTSWRPTTTSS